MDDEMTFCHTTALGVTYEIRLVLFTDRSTGDAYVNAVRLEQPIDLLHIREVLEAAAKHLHSLGC